MMKDNKENTTVLFSVDKETKKVYMESPDGRSDKKINLTDKYVWEIGPDDEIILVNRNEQDPHKRHYDFLELPDDLENKIQVNDSIIELYNKLKN